MVAVVVVVVVVVQSAVHAWLGIRMTSGIMQLSSTYLPMIAIMYYSTLVNVKLNWMPTKSFHCVVHFFAFVKVVVAVDLW